MCVFFFFNIYSWNWTSANSIAQENDIYHPESSHYSLLYQFNDEKKISYKSESAINVLAELNILRSDHKSVKLGKGQPHWVSLPLYLET